MAQWPTARDDECHDAASRACHVRSPNDQAAINPQANRLIKARAPRLGRVGAKENGRLEGGRLVAHRLEQLS